MVLLDVDHVVVEFFLQPQAELLDALGDDLGPSDQGEAGDPFVGHDLGGTQHPLLFALAEGDPLARGRLGGGEDRLHRRA